jgi:polyisoprenoid-binding protein YceI
MKFTLAALAVLSVASIATAATYDIDSAHSNAAFKVRHMMISNVKGEFKKTTGTVEFDPANLAAARINATIAATTISTREEKRDAHLKSADFFDVAKYPAITFQSTKVTLVTNNKYKAAGNLTIHGVTKPVTLDVEITPEVNSWGSMRFGASAATTVNRKDFGLMWNKSMDGGGVVVGDDVEITIDVELVKKGAAKTTN